jgi:CheY-like chemotaxis protein
MPSASPHAPDAASRDAAPTVLLVEDEPGVRAVVRRMLTRGGYTVLEASNGREALEIADGAGGRLDVVVTDVVMPELGGRAFAERLARLHPQVRVLFMSGYTDDEILRRGLAVPGAAFLEKPFSAERLLAAVRAALAADP